MTTRRTTWMVAGLCVLVGVVALAATPAAGEVSLGKRYINVLHGFSFQPPAGAQRKKKNRTISWTGIDPKTRAIAWTLTVSHVAEIGSKDLPLPKYMKALVAKLKKEENFNISSSELATIAGRNAIDIRATTGAGRLHLWQRQLWVEIRQTPREKQFLLFRISGSWMLREKMAEIVGAVAGSLKVEADPGRARIIRKANLDRGKALLKGITPGRVARVLRAKPHWYILTLNGAYAGFVRIQEQPGEYKGEDGYHVTTWAMMQVARQPVRLVRRQMFSTADRKTERWLEQWQVGDGKLARNGAEDGLKARNVIVCNVDTGMRSYSVKKSDVPEDIYLTRAIGMLLPRLVDLTRPGAYAFATYSSQGSRFDMRTFTVVGPAKLKTAAGEIAVVRATDRPAEEEEPSTLYLTPAGYLLKMESPEGLGMVASTEAMVRKKYPKALGIIAAMDGRLPKPRKPGTTGPRVPGGGPSRPLTPRRP